MLRNVLAGLMVLAAGVGFGTTLGSGTATRTEVVERLSVSCRAALVMAAEGLATADQGLQLTRSAGQGGPSPDAAFAQAMSRLHGVQQQYAQARGACEGSASPKTESAAR